MVYASIYDSPWWDDTLRLVIVFSLFINNNICNSCTAHVNIQNSFCIRFDGIFDSGVFKPITNEWLGNFYIILLLQFSRWIRGLRLSETFDFRLHIYSVFDRSLEAQDDGSPKKRAIWEGAGGGEEKVSNDCMIFIANSCGKMAVASVVSLMNSIGNIHGDISFHPAHLISSNQMLTVVVCYVWFW